MHIHIEQAQVAAVYDTLDALVKNSFISEMHREATLPMDIDWPSYIALQEQRILPLVVARHEGRIVGFATYFVMHNLHHKTLLCAHCDFLVVQASKAGHGIGRKLIEFSEKMLKERGVVLLIYNSRAMYSVMPLFAKMGYEVDEHCYRKSLQ